MESFERQIAEKKSFSQSNRVILHEVIQGQYNDLGLEVEIDSILEKYVNAGEATPDDMRELTPKYSNQDMADGYSDEDYYSKNKKRTTEVRKQPYKVNNKTRLELKKIHNDDLNLVSIYYPQIQSHAKIYLWKNKGGTFFLVV